MDQVGRPSLTDTVTSTLGGLAIAGLDAGYVHGSGATNARTDVEYVQNRAAQVSTTPRVELATSDIHSGQ